MGKLRKLPYGANYLDLDEMVELREAIEQKILFRYQTIVESCATRFEEQAAAWFGTKHALAVHNCTEALRLALLATRPAVGDVVYIPAVTFIAVAGAVLSCGLIPVLVDVDEDFSLDPAKLPADAERVIVAHMEGRIGDLPKAVPFVIEDTAQACGGKHSDGRFAGTAGYAGVFSFHHNKILTSGEGGLIITDDSERWELMRKYHDHGCFRVQGEYPRWENDTFYGENFVTSEGIAAIQLQQFRHLSKIYDGLERGYRILREKINDTSFYRVRECRLGDAKISLRLEFETEQLRRSAETALSRAGLPYWTLERYFLPHHPVMTQRKSIYSDGFPWNLAAGISALPDSFADTHNRLLRVLSLSISPESDEAAQEWEANAFVRALRTIA